MKIYSTKFKDLKLIRLKKYRDKRGDIVKIFNKENKNIKKNCFESYISFSKKGAVRGLHGQQGKYSQEKLIYCIQGKALDLAIDLRKKSKTYGKYFSIILSQKNALALFIPSGFAHGYYSFEKENIIYYKLDNYYNPKFESGISYKDSELNIKWPRKKMIVSKKDQSLLTFKEFKKKFKHL